MVVHTVMKFRYYLPPLNPFQLITNHQTLQYTFEKKGAHIYLVRWLDFLVEQNFESSCNPGAIHNTAVV